MKIKEYEAKKFENRLRVMIFFWDMRPEEYYCKLHKLNFDIVVIRRKILTRIKDNYGL